MPLSMPELVRQRTAEDFHDEVGNKLTRINVLTNVLKSKIGELTPDTRRIIDQIKSSYNVDDARVYVIGHSNGGFMTYRLACQMSDTFAGFGLPRPGCHTATST